MKECPRQEVEEGGEKDFSIVKEEIEVFLKNLLRRAQNFGVFDRQSRESRQQKIDYLEDLINFLENDEFLPIKSYFDELIGIKERGIGGLAKDLREEIATAKPRVDRLNEENAKLARQLEIEKKKGGIKGVQAILKEIGNIDDDIAGIAQDREKMREDLRRAKDDPELEKFRNFLLAINIKLKEDSGRN